MLPYGVRETARVEAAAYNGRPVAWHVIAPWTAPAETSPYTAALRAPAIAGLLLALVVIVGAVLFARRNLRMGRGDRRGATRLAYATAVVMTASWVLETHHVVDIGELYLLVMAASLTTLSAAFVWLLYVALEPHVRRRWPNTLIAWSRLLAGNVRDPLVGRDVLIGCLWMGAVNALVTLGRLAFGDVQLPSDLPVLAGARQLGGVLADMLLLGVTLAMAALFLLFVFRVLLRRDWAAVVLACLIIAGVTLVAPNARPPLGKFVMTVYLMSASVMLIRFGLLACAAGMWLQGWLNTLPLTTHFDAWYAGDGLLGFTLILLLVGYAFYTSLGGQPLFGRVSLDD
jgi:serine/threonine-protein kinase